MRVPRVLPALLLMLVAFVVCAGTAVAAGSAAPGHSASAAATDCGHPAPVVLAGSPDQVVRRGEDDPPVPATRPDIPVARVAAGHAAESSRPVPERALRAPSPVTDLCVDRN